MSLTLTTKVLADIAAERELQEADYGTNEDLEDGTGPSTAWLLPFTTANAVAIEQRLRDDYLDWEDEVGQPTWLHLVREEVAEVFRETDPVRLRAELIQVAALCVSWCEKIDGRK